MRVQDLMVREVLSCGADDRLNRAAQLMWEGDCGIVPVVDPQGLVVGVITDRDVCMAAYTRGQSLAALRVADAMARDVESCSPEATLEAAMRMMKESQVRRLPVTDGAGRLVGLLSLNDLAREARRQSRNSDRDLLTKEVADTLGVLCARRGRSTTSASRTSRIAVPSAGGDARWRP